LSRTDVQEIYQIRIELEGLAARLGATRISDKQVARMRQLVRHMDASTADHARWLAPNNDLHTALHAASENARLCALITDQMRTLQPYMAYFLEIPGRLLDTRSD